MAQTNPLVDAMGLEIQRDLQRVCDRIKRCSQDPLVRAQLMRGATRFMFGAACASHCAAAPSLSMTQVADNAALDLLERMKALDDLPGLSG